MQSSHMETRLRRWEIALALSVCITLCQTFTGAAWWGVMFPGLTGADAAESAETAKLEQQEAAFGAEDGGGYVVRLQVLDWIQAQRAAGEVR
ncbi:MAG: hypothetical protein LUC40_06020 [Oscillospiraceae bacterium]|nr:hypothetical protein [Oscillospiraceae bacterium]